MKPSSVYFIDSRISLADRHLLTDSLNEESIWYLVDEEKDGLSQIRDILIGYSGLDSLHLVSHGSPGSLLLGASVINNATLINQGALLAVIGQSLNEQGDLLIYGCNVASGSQGQSFIQQISQLTKADIAASTDQTGLLGNWELEYKIGAIEAAALNISTFDEALSLPTVSNLKTTNTRPTLSGSITLTAGRTVEVEVAGHVYKSGDGNLSIDNLAQTWKLVLPVDLAVGNYDVQVRIVDAPPTSGEHNSNPIVTQITGVQRQIRTGVEVANTVSVTANKLYNSTKAAEIFQVGKNTSALIFAGNGDTIDLSGRITDYTFTSVGNQLKINDGLYTTTISVGGALKLRTASGSTEVVYENANSIIKVGGQNIADPSFNRLNAISSTVNKSANAQSIIKDISANEIQIITEGGAWTPTIQHVTLSNAIGAQNGILNANDVVTASITFDGIVSVTGTPQLGLLLGGKKVSASYSSGSGSNTLTFNYAIREGDTDSNGISVLANSLSLNGGTINASLNYESVPDNSQFLVDTRIPVLTSGHVLTTGSVLELNFSEAVAAGSGNIVITKIPGLGASVVNGFATTNGTINSGGVLYTTSIRVADIDPATASYVLGGGNINSGHGIAGSAIQVTRSSGVLGFWVVTYDGGYTKAVKVEMVDAAGGILVKQLDARYKTGNYVTDSAVNWATESAGTVVTSNSAAGYGLSSFTLAEVVTAGTGTYTIAVTDSDQVSIFGSSVNITPTAGLPVGTYTVTYEAGTLTDQSGNVSPAIQAFEVTPSKISLGGISHSLTVTDGRVTLPFAQATISEMLATDLLTVQITFDPSKGILSGVGLNLPVYKNGMVTYELKQSTALNLQSQLRDLVFTPSINSTMPGQAVQTEFDITVNGGLALSTTPIIQIASQFIGTKNTQSPDYVNNIWDTNPISITTDPQGNVWVAYNDSGSVIKFSPLGVRLLKIDDQNLSTSAMTDTIDQRYINITTDPEGNLYCVSRNNNKLIKFSSSGEKLMTLGVGMSSPEDVIVDSRGDIWVINFGNSSLQKFTSSGVLALTITEGLSGPVSIALDGLGNIWVGNYNNGALNKFSPSGEKLFSIQQPNALPLDIVVDSQNNIWVANDVRSLYGSNVSKYAQSGEKILTLTEGIFVPASLAVDGDDNVWVANRLGNTIYRYTSSGEVFSTETWTTCCHMSWPQCVAIDRDGNAWVGNNFTGTVQKFGLTGVLSQDSANLILNVIAAETALVGGLGYVSPATLKLLTENQTDGPVTSSLDITNALVSANNVAVIQVLNASQLGPFTDAFPTVADIASYASNGVVDLLSHGVVSTATTSGATVLADVSLDGRYVVMGTNYAALFGPNADSRFIDDRSGSGSPYSDLIVIDRQTGAMALATHANTNNKTVGYQVSYVDMTADNKYLIMQTPWAENFGGFAAGGGANDVMVYTIATGDLRLFTHTSNSTLIPARSGAKNVSLTNDGKYVLLSANNASLFSGEAGGVGSPFIDSATGKADLFAIELETGTIKLLSHNGLSKSTSAAADEVVFVGQSKDGATVYFQTNDPGSFGLSSSGNWNIVASDISTNTTRLIASAPANISKSSSLTNFSTPAVWDSGFAVSDDERYVAFVAHMGSAQLAATNSSWRLDPSLASNTIGYVLLVADTITGSIAMANHSAGNPNIIGQQIMRDANGLVGIKGFTNDNSTLIFETSYGKDFGFTAEGLAQRAVVAYELSTGEQRLLSHSADSTKKVLGDSANFVAMTADTNWVLFAANDASKFGNNGKSFTDINPSGKDLFAVHVKTGEINLLSGTDGVSNGGNNVYTSVSPDGNTVYFTATNVNGMKTAQGMLIDNNLSGADLVSTRLNLLDLATISDSSGQIFGDGTTYDNVTAQKNITLNSILTPNTNAQLFDDFNGSRILVGATTSDASGNASWNLSNVASGNHHYTLWSPAEQLPILLSGNHAASSLDVRVL